MERIEPVLKALDAVLEVGMRAAQAAWGGDSVTDRFRGLYIGQAEVEQCLQRGPGEPGLGAILVGTLPVEDCAALKKLQELFSLTTFDLSVVVIALAPEVDLKYERLYAYLQDDVTRKRPTVDLALNLLSGSATEKLWNRRRFAVDAPLLRHRIVHLIADTNYAQPPLLAHSLKLDHQFVRMLIGDASPDSRLQSFSMLEPIGEEFFDGRNLVPLNAAIRDALTKIVRQPVANEERQRMFFHFRGSSRNEMKRAARAVADGYGLRLLTADLTNGPDDAANLDEFIRLVLNEAHIHNAIPYLEVSELACRTRLGKVLKESTGPVMLASSGRYNCLTVEGSRTIRVDFPPLEAEERLAHWESSVQQHGVRVDSATLDGLANRFRLTPEEIAQAVEESCAAAQWRLAFEEEELRNGCGRDPLPNELYAAARARSASGMDGIARKLTPIYTWDDLVLPADTLKLLHEICERVKRREHVMRHWGFAKKLSLGKGTSALFAGPSGTGKTMAAEVIANEVKLDLFTIDLASVVSKYIGETEKNLDRIFAAAEGTDAILFFDEADALFGKRSEVRDSHDRYANLEISYLLQKMDAYEGVTILASNLRQHMDESFIRRLAFTVLFPFPEEMDRGRIWRGIWPEETPVSRDIDFDELASRFKLSGGNIRNVALAAAFLAAQDDEAAQDGGVVRMQHLLRAVEREYQKMGKTVNARERFEADALVTQ